MRPSKVFAVNQVIFGERALGHEVDVAASTVGRRHFAVMLVTAQACRHTRPKHRRTRARVAMATDTVGLRSFAVLAMIEADDRARPLRGAAGVR